MYKVNQKFMSILTGREYVIKGAWDGAKPGNDHCFLMACDGKGHAYSGAVTHVRDVWNISKEEFDHLTGNCPEWFKLIPDSSESIKINISLPFFKELRTFQNEWNGLMKTKLGIHRVVAVHGETTVSWADNYADIMWRSEGLISPDTILILFNIGR